MNTNDVFLALSDPTRREILRLLQKGDATPSELIEKFNITKPSLSHHLDILKRAGLVIAERKGQNIIYSLNVSVFEEVVSMIMDFFKIKKEEKDEGTN
ncbi:MAG: autorepressor SdpR family transcription factor [Chitinispirillaceae bacterium]|nr:autorepressor SdpR family transcription factor [Chitinispirillaceae bacterium]